METLILALLISSASAQTQTCECPAGTAKVHAIIRKLPDKSGHVEVLKSRDFCAPYGKSLETNKNIEIVCRRPKKN